MQNGYYWSPGRVAGPLSVALDRRETVRIWNLNSVRPINEYVKKRVGVIDIEPESITPKKATRSKRKKLSPAPVEASKGCHFDLVGDPDDRDLGDRDPGEVIQPGNEVILTRRWPGKSVELRPLVPT